MATTATLSSKFQIAIPKAICMARNWAPGQTFVFIPRGSGVLLAPVPKQEAPNGLARGASAANFRDRADRT